ncbi:MAG TPA: sigma-70 family RNA polymerase sigma factor [Streptosporangiaceae bacterium]|nr:sigma-70 family RNA polymerase sigma factor [Streptosporangiaceae bacterium]
MTTPGPVEHPGIETVIAAQRGDRKALNALVAGYLPLLYNIVGRAMSGHAEVDDVVQETLLRVMRGLPDLRDPTAFRSWLVAIAIRQVRGFYAARAMAVPDGGLAEQPSAESDFADLTILQLGLSGQRRETAEATRWLDEDDRDLLALWWQESAGRLDRREVAEALGLPPRHAAVRIARMKEQLATARVVVRALHEVPPCDDLAVVTASWDHHPSPLWRKRVARHARNCAQCGAGHEAMVPAERLLAGLPLLPVPALLSRHLLAHGARLLRRRLPSARHARALGRTHARALGKTAAYLQPKVVAASVAVATGLAGGTIAVVHTRAETTAAVTVASPRPKAGPTTGASAASPEVAAKQTVASMASTPSRPRSTSPAAAPATSAPASSTKKGVGTWSFGAAQASLVASGATWFYNWGSSPSGVASPPGVGYVPMIWGASNVTSATLAQVKTEGRYLLGFNEPDLAAQSNMTVPQALSLWPQLEATGMTLGSPAVSANGATPGSWLDQFMSGAAARGDRVDFITLHWYGSDFSTGPAVSQLESYLQAVYDRYHKPIWLTEFGLANFGTGQFPTGAQQAAFVTAAIKMLDSLSYVQRYAWFALPANSTDGSMGLFTSSGAATETGQAFAAAGRS